MIRPGFILGIVMVWAGAAVASWSNVAVGITLAVLGIILLATSGERRKR